MADTTTTTYSIRLTVEDGTGVPGANSYVSLEYADSYCVERGYGAWMGLDEYTRKSAIVNAMDYVDNIFPWKGRKMRKGQALSFPRVGITDGDGFDVSGEIPEALRRAVCEAAFYAYDQQSLYEKSSVSTGTLKVDRKKADVVEVEKEYFSPGEFTLDWTSAYQSLDKMLRGLYLDKGAAKHVCIPAVWRY